MKQSKILMQLLGGTTEDLFVDFTTKSSCKSPSQMSYFYLDEKINNDTELDGIVKS